MRAHAAVTKESYGAVKAECQEGYYKAMDLFAQAHALDPAMTEANNNLALIKAHLVHDDVAAEELFKGALEAEEALSAANNIGSNNIGQMVCLHSNHALLVCSNGQLRRADDLLQRALSLDPGHSGAT